MANISEHSMKYTKFQLLTNKKVKYSSNITLSLCVGHFLRWNSDIFSFLRDTDRPSCFHTTAKLIHWRPRLHSTTPTWSACAVLHVIYSRIPKQKKKTEVIFTFCHLPYTLRLSSLLLTIRVGHARKKKWLDWSQRGPHKNTRSIFYLRRLAKISGLQ